MLRNIGHSFSRTESAISQTAGVKDHSKKTSESAGLALGIVASIVFHYFSGTGRQTAPFLH